MKKVFSPAVVGVSLALATYLLAGSALAAMPTTTSGGAQTRLQDAKLKACQAHEAAIKNRSSNLVDMANNMLSKFATIADRVENYYTSKVVPAGKTVTNYDALVADIATKKAAVQPLLAKAQTDASNFVCTSADPKGALTQYRQDMQAVKSALADYRTSIKNLIVAVQGVVGQENQQNNNNQ